MIHQHIRNNATTFQLPFISPINYKSHGVSTVRSNKDNSNFIKNNKTQPVIEKLNPLPFLNPQFNNKLPNNHIQRNMLSLSRNDENKNNNSLSCSNIEYKKLVMNNFIDDHESKKICKGVKACKFPIDDRNIISIRLESNWENTTKIMMYFISLFDKNNRQITYKNKETNGIIYITSYPESSSLTKLENLFDSSSIENNKTFFCEIFGNQKFTIYLSIPLSLEIGSILIFNPPTKSQSAVKDVSIYLNEELCIKGQIPQDFGLSMKFDSYAFPNQEKNKLTNEKNQEKHCSIPRTIAYSDDYGILPIKPISQISIEILETYNGKISVCNKENNPPKIKYSSENHIGVNGFDFFDILGNFISNQSSDSKENDLHFVKEAKIRGISELIHTGMLLKENKLTNNKEKMLLGLMDHTQYPSFNFTFNQPIYLSKILIWNYNGYGENLNCGIRKLRVFADNKLIWLGKIPIGGGNEKEYKSFVINIFQPNINIREIKI